MPDDRETEPQRSEAGEPSSGEPNQQNENEDRRDQMVEAGKVPPDARSPLTRIEPLINERREGETDVRKGQDDERR
jgi:hypothetical protein